MGVLYLQFSHLTRINEQLLELNLALRSCKINYIHIINLSGPNYYTDCKKVYTHTMPEKMLNRSTYIFHSMSFHVRAIIKSQSSKYCSRQRNNIIVIQKVNQVVICTDDSTLPLEVLDVQRKNVYLYFQLVEIKFR